MPFSSPKITYLKDYKVSDFLINHVDLIIELDTKKTRVTSRLQINANPASANKSHQLVLNGEKLDLHSICVNGTFLEPGQYQVLENTLVIDNVPDACVIELCNSINPEANTELSGLYFSKNKFSTHCEAEGFRRITYFLDRPDVMATYTTTLIADPIHCPTMISNGNLIAEGQLADGRYSITWDDPFKKPSYLFALVGGYFDCVKDVYMTRSGRSIELQFYAERGMGSRCKHAMESLKKAMLWDEVNYGRECDLDIYKVVAISDFNMGAMENKGLNIFNAKAVLASTATVTDDRFMAIDGTVAHEYFHNWTGNRVTVRDWFQLTVKEGLTTFRNQSYLEDTCTRAARAGYVKDLRTRQFSEDAGPLAHPVQPKSYITPDNFYTSTIYKKGAELFRMLETMLGVETFRKGMSLYFNRHDGQAVTIEQYIAAMEDASGKDLSQFMIWFHQAGTPEVTVSERYIPEEQTYILTLKQSTKPTPGQPDKSPLVIPVLMGLIGQDGAALPLYRGYQSEERFEELLLLTETEQEFIFKNVASQPVVSLFRNCSAPVAISFNAPEKDYQLIVMHDTDPFNRLEASQRYMLNQLERLMSCFEENRPMSLSDDFVNTMAVILKSPTTDLLLLGEMITVPSERYIADKRDLINVETVHRAREFLISELARTLQDIMLELYHKYSREAAAPSEVFDVAEAGKRRIKNQCLSYLLTLNNPDIQRLAMSQFNHELKVNMTNTLAVLKGLNQLPEAYCDFMIEQSYALWQDDSLTLDNWFSVQASAAKDTNSIKVLMLHPKFDINQPNKVNAVLGSFCDSMTAFHDSSGTGYQFLAEMIVTLDGINPKVAADQVAFLSNWRRFNSPRQELMKTSLQFILQHNITPRLFEVVSKSLSSPSSGSQITVGTATHAGVFFQPQGASQSSGVIEANVSTLGGVHNSFVNHS